MGQRLDGNFIAGLAGVLMALVIVSNGSVFRAMPYRKRVAYGAVWAVIIGIVAAVAERLQR